MINFDKIKVIMINYLRGYGEWLNGNKIAKFDREVPSAMTCHFCLGGWRAWYRDGLSNVHGTFFFPTSPHWSNPAVMLHNVSCGTTWTNSNFKINQILMTSVSIHSLFLLFIIIFYFILFLTFCPYAREGPFFFYMTTCQSIEKCI